MLIVLFTIQVICESKAISRDTTKLTRVLEIVEEVNSTVPDSTSEVKCDQLPPLVLAELLGEAYNARYMSINWPVASDDMVFSQTADIERSSYTHTKRKVSDDHSSFYVDDKYTAEISDRPAWDVNRAFAIEAKTKHRRRRSTAAIDAVLSPESEKRPDERPTGILDGVRQAQQQEELQQQQQQQRQHEQPWQQMVGFSNTSNKSQIYENGLDGENDGENFPNRNKRAYGRTTNADGTRKTYPWKCDSTVRWIDLGPDYFPRYLRTVECTKHYCWYKAFVCKAKSFAIKILRRRQGLCADASNLKKLSVFDFRGDFGEVWKWEEVAITFCCDCAIA